MAEHGDRKAPPEPTEVQRFAAEFIGTALLTFVAAGADIVDYATDGGIGHAARYVAPALLVMAMIWSLSGISGAHINPAVTCAFLLRRVFPPKRFVGYVVAQFVGAVGAALLLRAIFGSLIAHGVTEPRGFSREQGFSIEAVLTFVLVLTILGTAEEKAVVGKNSALAVGGIVALGGLAFSPLSGASMNPARSLGPMLVSGRIEDWWLYCAAPLVGAALAVAACSLLYGAPSGEAKQTAHGASK